MKFYNLYIHFENSSATYTAVTASLGLQPIKQTPSNFDTDLYDMWWYQVVESDNDNDYDFIPEFLNILEPNFLELARLGIKRSDIIFWLVYEYEHKCALGFNPKELKRLGESGIALNIDCFDVTNKRIGT